MKLYILNPKSTYKNPIGILRKSKKSVVNIGFLKSLLLLKFKIFPTLCLSASVANLQLCSTNF